MTSTTLIRGGTVLVGAPRDGRMLRADVLIENGTITRITPEISGTPETARVVDAAGTYVLPGFVDTHHHLWETVLRGMTAEWNILDFAWGMRFHHAGAQQPEDVYASTYAGAVAALDAGITTTIDFAHVVNTPDHAREGVRAVTDVGIRTLWCYGMTEAPSPTPHFASHGDRLGDLRALRTERFAADDARALVRLGVAVNDIGGVPWDVTRTEFLLARELGLTATAHTDSRWGAVRAPEIEWLHRDGLLGPGQIHAHVNAASDTELKLLADSGAGVSSTPETELQMGLGLPVFARAAELGIPSGLGTDIQANNSADPFVWMRLALHAENAHRHQAALESPYGTGALGSPHLGPCDVLHHATLGGAEVLGLGSVTGSLEPGKAADIVLLRTDGVHQRPVVDPMATIVMQSRASDIDTVLVGGEIVKKRGRLTGERSARAVLEVESAWERLEPRIEARGGCLPERPEGLLQQMAQAAEANAPAWAAQTTEGGAA
ncbi:amidohydrolase family protein [Streptomyces sp. 549]|uniref:amidohydrolase family protein n=1 Tax=Streptomyces sp. 549 TaxID=3049076 RepID=UPI0024C2E3C1|nr:amidohydrolase family protein [Streptomyces sp. 549]MDK1474506.1 amidohydrolase family protein [Streptomyces sp. 549]